MGAPHGRHMHEGEASNGRQVTFLHGHLYISSMANAFAGVEYGVHKV